MRRTYPARYWLIALACAVASVSLHAEDPPQIDHQVIFTSGQGGYHTYRIPALIVTSKGTLLAFCEGRKNSQRDSGDIDLLLRRSFDHGQTWQAPQVVWDDGENTCGNPCPVIDPRTGTILLLMTHNLGGDTEKEIVAGTSQGTRTVWISRSTDDGATWSKPVEITRDVKKPEWTWYATGPGIGIATRQGRLVIPCDSKSEKGKTRQSHVIYSDDGGESWKLGGVVGPNCNECQVAELEDGTLILNMRSYQGNKRRLVARSSDGGITWTQPREDPVLIEPVCQASIIRYPRLPNGLLFSNPASDKAREKVTVRLSRDGGQTWPESLLLHDGPSGYTCLAILANGQTACLYERGRERPSETITIARFNWPQVTAK